MPSQMEGIYFEIVDTFLNCLFFVFSAPGDIMENDEENNVKVDKFMILCEGGK